MKGRKPLCKAEYYINNREFYEEIVAYFNEKEEDPDTSIPECLWLKFRKLALRISDRPNFTGYSYKSEFISDAVILCAEKIDKFDPERSNNPFSFFTTTIINCYVGKIEKEKRESNYKDHFLEIYNEREDMNQRGQDYMAQRIYSGF